MKRRLDHERGETDRLSEEAAAERLKARQLERDVEQLHTDLEEYRWVHENFRTPGNLDPFRREYGGS